MAARAAEIGLHFELKKASYEQHYMVTLWTLEISSYWCILVWKIEFQRHVTMYIFFSFTLKFTCEVFYFTKSSLHVLLMSQLPLLSEYSPGYPSKLLLILCLIFCIALNTNLAHFRTAIQSEKSSGIADLYLNWMWFSTNLCEAIQMFITMLSLPMREKVWLPSFVSVLRKRKTAHV